MGWAGVVDSLRPAADSWPGAQGCPSSLGGRVDFFSLLAGIAVGYGLFRLMRWLNEAPGDGAHLVSGAADPTGRDVQAQAGDGASPEIMLARRLHELDDPIVTFANAAAHPAECALQTEFQDAQRLLSDPQIPLRTVLAYALGANWMLSCVGLAALKTREDRQQALDQVVGHLDKLVPWAMHFALEYFTSLEARPAVGRPLMATREWWVDITTLPAMFQDYFDRSQALGDPVRFPDGFAPTPLEAEPILALLARIAHPSARQLATLLEAARGANVDREFLTSFGRFWPATADEDAPVLPESWSTLVADAAGTVTRSPPRSLLVSGEPLAGKTTFLRLVAHKLAADGWQVFEASGPDLQAGQQWIGQLEERIRRAVEEVTVGKKLVWYVPDLLHLARSGTHQGQAASMLDQMLPAITSGRMVVWTEATPAAAARLVQTRPGLRRLLEMVALEPMEAAETGRLAEAVTQRLARRAALTVAPGTVQTALDSAQQYLSAQSFPGAPLVLLRLTVARAQAEKERTLDAAGVVETLSQLTGLPVSILDSRASLDLSAMRDHFAANVIGQDEAVTSVVERIAMLKAGLNDPGRPIGVFLFAGPTGTGKTELAKTTAEFLFGAADRMIRLDMSEFQTAESTGRLLGEGMASDAETLISMVRKQPFSVLLLDEFEKAHPRIWDLFLQVFDEGRLTDHMGQVADFRHCLIIMTSNLGATSHRTSGLGFAPSGDAFTSEQIQRAIAQTWRPEFQNRIDKVIVFQPLTRELMRSILKKELDRVLSRRGLKDRGWAVEWEASALEFLLEKGFSPEMGARPLKRAVDQYLLAPLARTIVERRFPEGEQFVFVRSDGRAIQAEFVDPDSEETWSGATVGMAAEGDGPTLPQMILSPQGSAQEADALKSALGDLVQRLDDGDWAAAKAALASRMSEAAFWQDPTRHETLARYALMDRITAAAETASRLAARLQRGTRPANGAQSPAYSRELIGRLGLQVHLVKAGLRDLDEAAPVEVALSIETALEGRAEAAAGLKWCGALEGMYRAWAERRHMQVSEIKPGGPGEAALVLMSGFGAARALLAESGLHVLERGDANSARVAARVKVVPAPLGDLPPVRLRADLMRALAALPAQTTVVRRYRSEPSPLVRNASGSWRSGKLEQVLAGDFDLIAADGA